MRDYSVVHVPQGRSARLQERKEMTGINGLYTDNFSSCVIIYALTSTRAVLIHADTRTSVESIVQELRWIDDAEDIHVCYRESYRAVNADRIIGLLSALMPDKSLREQQASSKEYGIFLSYKERAGRDEVRVQLLPKKPDGLIYHPKEQFFLAVQKAEQIIGIREMHSTHKTVQKDLCIYDGFLWAAIDKRDLTIRQDNELTQEEMSQFKPGDDYLTIAGKLLGIVKEINKCESITTLGNVNDFVSPIAVWLEGYLNNFNADLLLRRNLKSLVDKSTPNSAYSHHKPSEVDKTTASKCADLVSGRPIKETSAQLDRIIGEYQCAPDTKFKKLLLEDYRLFRRHYSQRSVYIKAAIENKTRQEEAGRLSKEGVQHYKDRKFDLAKNVFREASQHCIISCDRSDKILKSILNNVARAYQRSGNPKIAKSYMCQVLQLVQTFDRDNIKEINKINEKIAECDEALSRHSVELHMSAAV